MKLSLSNGVFSKHSLEENMAGVKRLGFENVEFNMKAVAENDEDAVYLAKELVDSLGLRCLTLHAATLHVKNESEIPKAIYYGRVSADFASKLSAPVLVVHSNVSRKLPENLRNRFMAEILRKVVSYAESLGLRLALENLSYASSGFGKNVAELEEVLSVIDDGTVGITLDFCHAEASGQTQRLLEKYHDKLLNIHISNRAHKPFLMETPSLKTFLTKLQDYGYSGPLTIELSSKCTVEEIQVTKSVLEKLV
ncbi:MAG: sugar phosphate isomerase/epimerase [Candidatus Bathyarchaeota archaeon]|nr:sugar phosphate isomerase/epimerase [Candidatus Bathyarchaeota archaeon]